MSKLAKALFNILVLIVTLAVMILVLEWLLRLTGIQKVPPLNPPIYRTSKNAILSYELIPSITKKAYGATVTTNELGLRSPALKPGVPTIAMIGDSATFGLGVEDNETIPAFLQELLPRYQVINAGVNGYNIEQEVEQYRTKISALSPVASVIIFNANDVEEALKLDSGGYFVPKSFTGTLSYQQRLDALLHRPGTLPIPGKTFLQMHSALFNLLVRVTKNMRSHQAEGSIFSDPVTDVQVERYVGHLSKLATMMGRQPRLFVIWPETNLHLRSRTLLTKAAEERGFKVLDLYEIYGNTYQSLGWDGHPNAVTTKRTAYLIAEALKEWNLISK